MTNISKDMRKNNHDYSIYLAIIVIWIMIGALAQCAGGFAQCESARNLDRIKQELSAIRHELNMMRYK
jgi:hypothetical protein